MSLLFLNVFFTAWRSWFQAKPKGVGGTSDRCVLVGVMLLGTGNVLMGVMLLGTGKAEHPQKSGGSPGSATKQPVVPEMSESLSPTVFAEIRTLTKRTTEVAQRVVRAEGGAVQGALEFATF